MILPIRTDSPLRTTPWMNWAIVFVNIALFMVQRRSPLFATDLLLDPRDPAIATYLTYAFAHANLAHLLGNMLFLFIFGNNVNDRLGPAGYLAFYLAGGVLAGVGHVMTHESALLGASGAVAAVTGAYLALFPRSSITLIYWLVFFVGTVEVPSLWFIVVFFAKDVVLNLSGGPSDVAHVAHLSGVAFGFGACLALMGAGLLPRDQFDVLALAQRWNRRRQYRGLVREGFDPFAGGGEAEREPEPAPQAPAPPGSRSRPARPSPRPARPPRPKPIDMLPAPPDPRLQRIQDLRAEIAESLAHHNHPHAAWLYLELKRLDIAQVLNRQAQLDVANQLASQQLYAEAADAYEQFLTHYASFDQIEQVELMLGLIYARYLGRHERAREFLLRAQARLQGERELEMARTELNRIASKTQPADQAEEEEPRAAQDL